MEYVVWYRQTDAPEWRTMRILSRTAMEATITHLEPNHEYEFMVLSQDRFGEGMFSKAFKYFTKRKFDIIDCCLKKLISSVIEQNLGKRMFTVNFLNKLRSTFSNLFKLDHLVI